MVTHPSVHALHVQLSVGRKGIPKLANDSTSDDEAKVRTIVSQGERMLKRVFHEVSKTAPGDRLVRHATVITNQAKRNRHDSEATVLDKTANDRRGPANIDRVWQSNLVGATLLVAVLALAVWLIASLFANGLRAPTQILAILLTGMVAFVAGDWVGRGRLNLHRYLGITVVLTAGLVGALFASGGAHPVLGVALDVLVAGFAGGLGYLVGRGRILGPNARMEERERTLELERARTQESLETSNGLADLHDANEIAYVIAIVDQLVARTLQGVEELLDELSSSGRKVDTEHLRAVARSLVGAWPRVPKDMEGLIDA